MKKKKEKIVVNLKQKSMINISVFLLRFSFIFCIILASLVQMVVLNSLINIFGNSLYSTSMILKHLSVSEDCMFQKVSLYAMIILFKSETIVDENK